MGVKLRWFEWSNTSSWHIFPQVPQGQTLSSETPSQADQFNRPTPNKTLLTRPEEPSPSTPPVKTNSNPDYSQPAFSLDNQWNSQPTRTEPKPTSLADKWKSEVAEKATAGKEESFVGETKTSGAGSLGGLTQPVSLDNQWRSQSAVKSATGPDIRTKEKPEQRETPKQEDKPAKVNTCTCMPIYSALNMAVLHIDSTIRWMFTLLATGFNLFAC